MLIRSRKVQNEDERPPLSRNTSEVVTYGLLVILIGSLLLNIYQLTEHNRQPMLRPVRPDEANLQETRIRVSLERCCRRCARQDSLIHSLEQTLTTLEARPSYEKSSSFAGH